MVAEYLLGDFPLTFLSPLLVMAPFYGGGALLIRELTRRTGRGWPTIFLLSAAYALIEEGFTTQSLFNPNFLGIHFLAHAWIPALGIGGWWTMLMFNVHIFWSMGVSIALVEALFPSRTGTPWLGPIGTAIAALLFILGGIASTAFSIRQYHFIASHAQFAVTAVLVVLFICAAFLIPFPRMHNRPGPVPSPWITGLIAFLGGIAIFLTPPNLNWGAVAFMLVVDAAFLAFAGLFSSCADWTALHTLSLAAGGAIFYGVHAFIQPPVVGKASHAVVLAGHCILLAACIALIAMAVHRTRGLRVAAPDAVPEAAHP
jgi:hypothetical protein